MTRTSGGPRPSIPPVACWQGSRNQIFNCIQNASSSLPLSPQIQRCALIHRSYLRPRILGLLVEQKLLQPTGSFLCQLTPCDLLVSLGLCHTFESASEDLEPWVPPRDLTRGFEWDPLWDLPATFKQISADLMAVAERIKFHSMAQVSFDEDLQIYTSRQVVHKLYLTYQYRTYPTC